MRLLIGFQSSQFYRLISPVDIFTIIRTLLFYVPLKSGSVNRVIPRFTTEFSTMDPNLPLPFICQKPAFYVVS